jgi:3-dehydroquinate synthase
VLLAVGGGVVGDLAGFAAATLLRGVRFVQVPTTLLAMVDASVGGKTAIDRPQGKNLVGAFHQPSAVFADVDLLRTLPARELRSGLAEVVKIALVGDPSLLESIEASVEAIANNDLDALVPLVRASVAHKAFVVSEDERDVTGARAALNFGHTVGHALEAHGGYSALTHGESVALGMVAALRIGVARSVTPAALLDRTVRLLAALGLPTELDARTVEAALPRILHDKKRVGTHVDFVLVPDVGRTSRQRLSLDEIRAAVARA